jgi:excisionase family DNA binding protein
MTKAIDQDDRPLSLKEAGELVGLSHWAMRDRVRRGAIAHYRLGRTIRIPAVAVRQMLAESYVPAKQEHAR